MPLCSLIKKKPMKKGRGHCISIQNYNTQVDTGKFIYSASTLHGKQLLLKRDQSQRYCLPSEMPSSC